MQKVSLDTYESHSVSIDFLRELSFQYILCGPNIQALMMKKIDFKYIPISLKPKNNLLIGDLLIDHKMVAYRGVYLV